MSAEETDPEEGGSEEELQTGNLVAQSLPHSYERDALSIEIDEFRLDGSELDDRGDLNEPGQILSLVDETWSTLSVEGTVELKSDTIHEVFPPEEWDEPPGRLVLVKTNRLAISRSRTILSESPVEDGEHSFEIQLNRDNYRGTAHIEPYLTRATSRESGPTNCASKVGSRLANGDEWILRLDESVDGGGLLMPRFEEFEESDRLPDNRHIHYLSLESPENPQLYLNRSHGQVANVLKNEGTTGGYPRLRDVLYDYIEHSVWTQLLIQTARDTDTDTGETKHAWQDDVLELFLDELYPELEEEMAAVQLATDIRSVEDLPALVQKIERAVHRQYDIPNDTTKLIEEAIQNDN